MSRTRRLLVSRHCRADLGFEIDTIELFEDVLDFVRDELHGVRRRREKDVGGEEDTVPALENGTGVEGWPTLQLLEAQYDLQVLRGDEAPALAVECRGRPPHAFEERLED